MSPEVRTVESAGRYFSVSMEVIGDHEKVKALMDAWTESIDDAYSRWLESHRRRLLRWLWRRPFPLPPLKIYDISGRLTINSVVVSKHDPQ